MKKKITTLLVAALVLQLALIAYVYRPGQDKGPAARELFPGLDASAVTALTITDDSGKSITLTRKDKAWEVGAEKYPGDGDDITRVLKKIAALKTARLVTKTKASHVRLKVAETLFNRKVDLKTAGGDTIFYLGTAPSAKTVHLRKEGENEVYLVKDLAAWELQTGKESWWRDKYIDWQQKKLTGLTLHNANGDIRLGRDDKGGWKLEGDNAARADKDKVISLVSTLSTITLSDYLPADTTPPKEAPAATVIYHNKDGEVTLTIWPKKKDDADYLAKSTASPFYARIRAYVVDDILKAKPEQLLATEKKKEEKATKGDQGAAADDAKTPQQHP